MTHKLALAARDTRAESQAAAVAAATTTTGTTQPAAKSPPGAAARGETRGAFRIQVEDEGGRRIVSPTAPDRDDPTSPQARVLAFHLVPDGPQPTPADQLALQNHVDRLLHVARKVYPPGDPAAERAFRPLFLALTGAARWGTEGQVSTAQAAQEVREIEQQMTEDLAGPLKNAHLLRLGQWAAGLSLPCLAIYAVLQLSPSRSLTAQLLALGIERAWLASFMLLWVGCFVGVCLSYALRSTTPKLDDLVVPDRDHLQPPLRMVLAGALASLLVLLALLKLVDLQVGSFSLRDIVTWPTLAFVVGCLCGIAEQALPGGVTSRAGKLLKL